MSDKKFIRRKKTKQDDSKEESSLVVVDLNSLTTFTEENSSNSLITLNADKEEIVEKINETDDVEELKNLTNLFEISLAKKEIARTSKQSDLLDKLTDIAEERISKGDYLTNDEVLNYHRAFQSNVDKSKKNLNNDVTEATNKVANTINEININVNDTSISRESRERILGVVDMILKSSNNDIEQEDVLQEEGEQQ